MEPTVVYPRGQKLDAAYIMAAAIILYHDPGAIPIPRFYREINQDIVLSFNLSNDIETVQIRIRFKPIQPTPEDIRNHSWTITSATINWPDAGYPVDEWPASRLKKVCQELQCWPNPPISDSTN